MVRHRRRDLRRRRERMQGRQNHYPSVPAPGELFADAAAHEPLPLSALNCADGCAACAAESIALATADASAVTVPWPESDSDPGPDR